MLLRWEEQFTLPYSWDSVMKAVQLKYPNPFNQNVLSVDVFWRRIDQQTGCLNSFKIINSSWPMFSNCGEMKAIEYSVISPLEKRMVLETHNVGLRSVVKATEKLEYEVHPDKEAFTLMKHTITLNAFPLIAYPLLAFSEHNAALGRQSLGWTIENRVPKFMSPSDVFTPLMTPYLLDSEDNLYQTQSNSDTSSQMLCKNVKPTISPFSEHRWSIENLSFSYLKSFIPKWRPFYRNKSRPAYSVFASSISSPVISDSRSEPPLTTVTSDVSAITDNICEKCQHVAGAFSRVDEYVLIM